MNRTGIFSDETMDYLSPPEPSIGEMMSIKLRTATGAADQVILIQFDSNEEFVMRKIVSDELFDYYETSLEMTSREFRYYFKVQSGNEFVYFTKAGVTDEVQKWYTFHLISGFKVPEWSKGAIMYQIFVDRFRRGDSSNDVMDDEYIYIGLPTTRVVDWDTNPKPFDVGYFYGGDLQGVWDKLDYLQALGVEVIYFNPLFVSPSNHKYDTQDYAHIDPHYTRIVKDGGEVLPEDATSNEGASKYILRTTDKENLEASDAFFAEFMSEVRRRGMRVIMDGVFNHCGSFNKWLDREGIYKKSGEYPPGAYESKDSPYHLYFEFFKNNEEDWPNNTSYDGWWGHDTLPKLYFENSLALRKEVFAAVSKWLLPPYSIDGWRLDVAADLGHSPEFNHVFWRKFREQVKSNNPEAIILAEHYGDPSNWLDGKQWDTIMNYDAFMEPLSFFLTGMEKHSEEFKQELLHNGKVFMDTLLYNSAKMPLQSCLCAMNELSNHDHSRFLTRTNHVAARLTATNSKLAEEGVDVSVLRQAVVMQMTMQGAPTIYYGDEAGLCGFTDPDNRRTYPWGREDFELIDFHKYMTKIHRNSKALKLGSLIPVLAITDLVAYARVHQGEIILVVVYTGAVEQDIVIPAWIAGYRKNQKVYRHMYTCNRYYNVGVKAEKIEDGILRLKARPNSAYVFSCNKH